MPVAITHVFYRRGRRRGDWDVILQCPRQDNAIWQTVRDEDKAQRIVAMLRTWIFSERPVARWQ